MRGGNLPSPDRPRIAVVTPFLDKRHGTERCVAEQVERLVGGYGYEVHVYSERVEDIRGPVVWHRVPVPPGPHLVRYVGWFLANHLVRLWDRWVHGLRYDLVYSPGVNCLDADVSTVHIVFAELYRRIKDDLCLRHHPVKVWPRLLHRRLYYRLIIWLERRVYPKVSLTLAAVSQKTAGEITRYYGRNDVQVIYYGIDGSVFNPETCRRRREEARRRFGFAEGVFVVLLIGNDWKTKGLPCLLEAVAHLRDLPLHLLVVGRDDRALYEGWIRKWGLSGRLLFEAPSPDVVQFYAAADLYVGPSLEDAFGLPPAEAMACGLPVIVSRQAGVSEIITHGVDGLILEDPRDARRLACLIRMLYEDTDLRQRLGENAARTCRRYTWERNAVEMHALFQEVLRRNGEK